MFTTEERLARAIELGIIVDEQDEWLLSEYTWNLVNGYPTARFTVAEKMLIHAYLHHCIMGVPIYAGEQIDHIDRNPLHNRRSNLRYATPKINAMNSYKKADPMLGVYQQKSGVYYAALRRDQVLHFSPATYDTVEEAQRARDVLRAQLDGQDGTP